MKSKRVEERSRQANWGSIRKAEGKCPHCGGDREAKPGGGYFRFCPEGRRLHNERQKLKMQERRRSGLVDWSGRLV